MAEWAENALFEVNKMLRAEPEDTPYPKYSCQTVSWDDVQRNQIGGTVSSWGKNITDTRLFAKDGRQLFTIRPGNWNERLCKVSSEDLLMVASSNQNGCEGMPQPCTLRSVLEDPSGYGGYAGLNVDSLANESLDTEVSVRFQTVFLPVDDSKAQIEFAPEVYSYNTLYDDDPRNLILLCTSQGLAIQQDGSGAKKLYHHHIENTVLGTRINRHWLEAESSNHKVGGSQNESRQEQLGALHRGKAISSRIGTRSMGSRFNVLMTIQIPLAQKKKIPFNPYGSMNHRPSFLNLDSIDVPELTRSVTTAPHFGPIDPSIEPPVLMWSSSAAPTPFAPEGSSSAARLSRGSFVDSWKGLTVKEPDRHSSEHISVTIVTYYTCAGNVPTEDEIFDAIDDLEHLYNSLENGNLEDDKFQFMTSDLKTGKSLIDLPVNSNSTRSKS